MQTTSRRQFLRAGAAGGLAAAAGLEAAPLRLPIGFQVYPIREMLAKDFEGTLRQMAALGYRSVEMCSPPGYERLRLRPADKDAGCRDAPDHQGRGPAL